jgi:Uma2 family endonuclease
MAPATTTTRLTYDDLLALPADGNRYEIIDGELYVNPAPATQHQRISRILLVRIGHYLELHGGGEVFGAPLDVVFANESVVQPDILVIKADRASIIGEKNVHGAPNLCIEVLSPSTRGVDEIEKRKLYERGGVDEYWIVDPEGELVKIYRRSGGAFEPVAEISTETGGTITTPLLPHFAIEIGDVFKA